MEALSGVVPATIAGTGTRISALLRQRIPQRRGRLGANGGSGGGHHGGFGGFDGFDGGGGS
jgi:hypothetical protein